MKMCWLFRKNDIIIPKNNSGNTFQKLQVKHATNFLKNNCTTIEYYTQQLVQLSL